MMNRQVIYLPDNEWFWVSTAVECYAYIFVIVFVLVQVMKRIKYNGGGSFLQEIEAIF